MAPGVGLAAYVGCDFSPVATRRLGTVKRCVGASEGLVSCRIGCIEGSNADADGDGKFAVPHLNRSFGNLFTQALSKSGSRVQIGSWKQDGKFIATDTGSGILSA